jgi:dipeptidase E
MPAGTIVAIGGFVDADPLFDYVLGIARGRRVLHVPTASMENSDATLTWYARAARHGATMSHLHFAPWPPANLRELALDHDVILVPGGNTANMLAVWRVHGFDTVAREAWENGVVLAGWSAGAICWFESGVTDSFGPQLAGMECLGFLPGSACHTTTASRCGGPATPSCSAAGSHPGSRSTTPPPFASTAPTRPRS